MVDYVAATLLIFGAVGTLQSRYWGGPTLSAGWAFGLGMGWMSLAGNVAEGVDPHRDASVAGLYIDLIAAGMVWSLLGLALAILGLQRNPR
ncbi:hypothetical protein HKD42_04860 [Altererythrobacter sp. RZ02]|uniref:Uncharacterized protein n=1 Tax=Pontixanthobacter rizhaonensis TaxID=2730337 RepID=A0A848QFM0_9SPHN|nr:hypothetical protein [Pontixanthobacter rizhaonensis]NMW31382.1 hypothetical protein [Pontixanthobacter rizhaonensis]